MAMELFFENLIKIEESKQDDGLLLSNRTGEIDSKNIQFFEHLIETLDSSVYFTRETSESKTVLFENSQIIQEAENNGKPAKLVVKVYVQSKGDKVTSDRCFAYFNEAYKNDIKTLFDAKDGNEARTLDIEFDGSTINIRGTNAATKKVKKRNAVKGVISATYLDGKILPSTEAEYNEFIDDCKLLNEDIEAIKKIIKFNKESSEKRLQDFAASCGTTSANVTYDLSNDKDIHFLSGVFSRIAANAVGTPETAKDFVEKVFNVDPLGLPPDALEACALIWGARSYGKKIEFFSMGNFKLIDFAIIIGPNEILPISVKDENGGNSSTCVSFLRGLNYKGIFGFDELDKSKVNQAMNRICEEYTAILSGQINDGEVKNGKEITNPKNVFEKIATDEEKDILSRYFASYLIKASFRNELTAKEIPGYLFSGIIKDKKDNGPTPIYRTNQYVRNIVCNSHPEEYAKKGSTKKSDYEKNFNQAVCEKIAVQMINCNPEILSTIRNGIANYGKTYFGQDVIKVKPNGYSFIEIRQDASLELRELGEKMPFKLKSKGDSPIKYERIGNDIKIFSKEGSQGQYFGYEFKG